MIKFDVVDKVNFAMSYISVYKRLIYLII